MQLFEYGSLKLNVVMPSLDLRKSNMEKDSYLNEVEADYGNP